MIKQEINIIKLLLAENKIENSFAQFFQLLNRISINEEIEEIILGEIYNETILLSSKYHELKTAEFNEIELPHILRIHHNKIVHYFLQLLDRISKIETKNVRQLIPLNTEIAKGKNSYIVKLEINKTLSEFSLEEQKKLINSIEDILEINGQVEIRKVVSGSLIFYIALAGNKVIKLFDLFSKDDLNGIKIYKVSFISSYNSFNNFNNAYDLLIGKYVKELNKNAILGKIILLLLIISIITSIVMALKSNDFIYDFISYMMGFLFFIGSIAMALSIRVKKWAYEVIKGRTILNNLSKQDYNFSSLNSANKDKSDVESDMNEFFEEVMGKI